MITLDFLSIFMIGAVAGIGAVMAAGLVGILVRWFLKLITSF